MCCLKKLHPEERPTSRYSLRKRMEETHRPGCVCVWGGGATRRQEGTAGPWSGWGMCWGKWAHSRTRPWVEGSTEGPRPQSVGYGLRSLLAARAEAQMGGSLLSEGP